MPRTTHVKRAQQRYATIPVLDDDGHPVKIPLTNKDGSPKKTKTGREVFITKTRRDTEHPLPLLKCDYAGCPEPDKEIQVGTPYKHMSPRSGPYGGRQINRHESCPQWNVWDYSQSTSAMVARVQNDCHNAIDEAALEEEGDFDSLREELAGMAEEIYQEKQDNLDNLPEGLQSGSELEEIVSNLETWYESIGEVDAPDFPEVEDEVDCETCGGNGKGDCSKCEGNGETADGEQCPDCEGEGQDDCQDCEGTGSVENEEGVDADELVTWADEAKDALREAVDGYEG